MSFVLALVVAALSGFLALAYEILWYRAVSFMSEGRAETFALMLGSYLAGLSLGALGVRRLGKEGVEDLLRLLPMSAADFLDEWFEDDALKGALGAVSVRAALITRPVFTGDAALIETASCNSIPPIAQGYASPPQLSQDLPTAVRQCAPPVPPHSNPSPLPQSAPLHAALPRATDRAHGLARRDSAAPHK